MRIKASPEARGRPRGFDSEQALDQALKVFWQKGYEGASLSDLTKAMGINRPSLYAAFGDKEALFHKVLDRYEDGQAGYLHEALNAPTAREVAGRLLFGAAATLCRGKNPVGCLLVQGALTSGEGADSVRRELAARREKQLQLIRRRLQRAKRESDLPPQSNPAALARYLSTVLHGMAVQAAGGARQSDLQRVAEIAWQSWPR